MSSLTISMTVWRLMPAMLVEARIIDAHLGRTRLALRAEAPER